MSGESAVRRIIANLPATAGSASSRQKYEVAVGNSRLLLALYVVYLCRNRCSETSVRNARFWPEAAIRGTTNYVL